LPARQRPAAAAVSWRSRDSPPPVPVLRALGLALASGVAAYGSRSKQDTGQINAISLSTTCGRHLIEDLKIIQIREPKVGVTPDDLQQVHQDRAAAVAVDCVSPQPSHGIRDISTRWRSGPGWPSSHSPHVFHWTAPLRNQRHGGRPRSCQPADSRRLCNSVDDLPVVQIPLGFQRPSGPLASR
jgi:hypothetical protein